VKTPYRRKETDAMNPEDIEPTPEEIEAAAKAEAAATKSDAKVKPAPRRGPGRPPGSTNKSKDETAARSASSRSRLSVLKPTGGSGADTGQTEAERDAKRKARETRKKRVDEMTKQAMAQRVNIVKGVGVATGVPPQFLAAHPEGPDDEPDTSQPEELTAYGEALAPKDWQVRWCADAVVRVEGTEAGQRFIDEADKWMPWVMVGAGVIAVGMYTVTAMQTAAAIKPMIAAEIAAQAEAAAAEAAAQAPGASGGATG
jgi:hypothetical protein